MNRYIVTLITLFCLLIATTDDAHALRSRRGNSASSARPTTSTTRAQASQSPWVSRFEIGGYAGWMLAGEIPVATGDLVIVNDVTYGGHLTMTLFPGSQVEFGYSRIDTRVDIKQFNKPAQKITDMALNYYQLSGVYEPAPFNRVKPFISGGVGFVQYVPDSNLYSSDFRFDFTLGAGLKIMLHPRIGIRGKARLILPMYFSGGGVVCGTGGCAGAISTTVIAAQGDFTGGVFLAF